VRQTLFTPFAQATVRHYVEVARHSFRRWSLTSALFISERGNTLSTAGAAAALRPLVARACAAGFRIPRRFGWHSLRRSFATLYAEEHPGHDSTLLDMLGHTNLSSLHRYIQHSRGYHDKVMDEVLVSLLPR
jgi:site-specific recombinase XerD